MANDEFELDGEPWVSKFVEKLQSKLKNMLGANGKAVKIYFAGRGSLQYGDQLESCRDDAKRSAVFLIIGSPRYLDVWPVSELRAFASTGASATKERLLIAEMLPLEEGQSYPLVGDPLRALFWRPTGMTAARPFRQVDDECDIALTDLAAAITKRLKALKALDEPRDGQRPPNPDYKTVLLAQVTDDLEPLSQKLRTHLEQFQIKVLPPSGFEEEGEEFRGAFKQYLDQADIVVQLLGENPSRRPRAMPNGYDGFQAEQVRARSDKVLMQWRGLTFDPGAVDDVQHSALLSLATAMDFEPFKEMVVRRATAPPPPAPPPSGRKGYILIDADEIDGETARKVLRECRRRQVTAVLADPKANLRERSARYVESEQIAIIHENSAPKWLNAQLFGFVKATLQRPPKGKCLIYMGPPPPKDPDEVTVVHPAFEFVDAPNGDLDKLFAKLF